MVAVLPAPMWVRQCPGADCPLFHSCNSKQTASVPLPATSLPPRLPCVLNENGPQSSGMVQTTDLLNAVSLDQTGSLAMVGGKKGHIF